MYRSREAVLRSDAVGKSHTGQLAGWTILHLSLDLRMWLYVLLALCLVSALAFVHVWQMSYVANQIEVMEGLEEDLLERKQGNNALRLQISQLEQMPRLKAQAQAMGLGKPEHIEYVEVSVPLAVTTSRGGAAGAVIKSLAVGAAPSRIWWVEAAQQFGGWVQVSSK
jgi:cell division protein FtsL